MAKRKFLRRKLFTSVLVTVASIATSMVVLMFFSDVENNFYDFLFNNFRDHEIDNDPVIVAIDQNTLNVFANDPYHILWPWPREIYKPVVDYLDFCGASVISFDILFTTPGVDRMNSIGSASDSIFASALKNSQRTTIAMQFEDSTLAMTSRLISGYLEKSAKIPDNIYQSFDKASLPIDLFQNNTQLLGAVNIPSTSSGIIRKLPLLFEYQGKVIPHLSLSTYLLSREIDSLRFNKKTNALVAGNLEIPLDKEGNYLINWYGKGGVNNSFQYYSFADLLKSALRWQIGQKPIVPPEKLKGRAVFIGAVAAGLLDMKSTPVSGSSPYPGIEIYTTMYKNFITEDFLRHFPLAIWFLVLIAFFICKSAVWQSERFAVATITSIILILMPFIISIYLFYYNAILFPVLAFESGLILNLVVSILIEYFWAGKRNRKLRKNFGRYLEPRLVKMIADAPEAIELAGDEVVATVLFSDIKDFTKMSSTLNSKKIVKLLNNYFEEGEKIIFKNNGMLDKYTGDGLMALFGVPVPDQNHAISACHAILDFDGLQNIEILKDKAFKIRTRIGVHTGPLVAGNIGSSRRVDFTAIGSTVNIAARLEQVNKVFGTNNIISHATCDLVNNYFICRDLDYYKVRGIEKALHIFTVLCKTENATSEINELISMHNVALEKFRNKKTNEAAKNFHKILEKFPNDKVSEYFINRCQL